MKLLSASPKSGESTQEGGRVLRLLTDLSILRYSFSQAVSPIDGEATTERLVSEGAREVLPTDLAPKKVSLSNRLGATGDGSRTVPKGSQQSADSRYKMIAGWHPGLEDGVLALSSS